MAVEADRVVVTLLAENDQFDAAAKASAQNFAQSMGTIQSSGAAAEKGVSQFSSALKENRLGMNQSRVGMLEFQHVARGVSDQFAASGLSTQLFTSHIGELSEAAVLSGGAFGGLGTFLQGPWGIALTLAASAAAVLISKLGGSKDTVDDLVKKLQEHHDKTVESNEADAIWSQTVDGLAERIKKTTEELEKRVETQSRLNEALIQTARNEYAAAISSEAHVEAAGGTIDEKASANVTAAAVALHNAEQSATEASAEASTDLSKATSAWIDAQKRFLEIVQHAHPELTTNQDIQQSIDIFDKAATDAAAAGVKFEPFLKQVHTLDTGLLNGSVSADTFAQKMRGLATSLEATTAAFKNQDNAISRFKQSVIGAEGTGQNRLGASAAGFGQFMPSTFEGYFKQLYPQQAAGMSNAEIDALRNNRTVATAVIDAATKDYITVIKAAGQQITAASLYTVHLLGAGDAAKLFGASPDASVFSALGGGRHASAVLAGNPFLNTTVGGARAAIAKRIGDSSGAVSSGAAAIAQQQEDAAKKEAEQQASFTQEMDGLNKALIDARKGQVKDELTQLDIQEDEVKAELQKRDDTYASAVTTGKLTQAQADALTVVAQQVAAAKLAAIETEKQAEIAKRQHELDDQNYGFAEDALKAQDEAATSQAQHRSLQLAILDIVYQQKLADLEYLKLQAERNGQLDEANRIQGQIDQLPNQRAADTAQTIRGTMDPLESWLKSVPHDAHAVTEALQGIAVNGFDQIASSIAGVVTGTQTLGQAFASLAQQAIGDIVQMTVKMLIFRALSSVLGGGFDQASFANTVFSNNVFASQSITPTLPDVSIITAAGGASGIIGGIGGTDNNLLSMNGQPVAWVSKGEGLTISPSNARAASPWTSSQVPMVIVGVQANDYFEGKILQVTGPVIAQASTGAAYGGAALARNNLATRSIHQLGSRG